MRRILGILLKVLIGIVAAVVLAAIALTASWLIRRQDPISFLPATYVAYVQVPSIRGIYDEWLNREAVDVVMARPDLAPYRSVIADVRGLALTSSPVLRTLLDVHADVMLLQDRKLLAVLDLGWRGILTPLARIVGPLLGIRGFSFLNDAGVPIYRYTTGATTIQAVLANNVAIVSLDADVLKTALALHATDAGLAAKASRELLGRIRLRARDALRVLVDTASLSTDLLSGTPFGSKILDAVEIPGQTMLDVRMSDDRLSLSIDVPLSVSMPELAKTLANKPAPIGVLRSVPSSASLLSVSNIAPLADLYRLAAAFQGKDVEDIYARADAGARSVLGMGIDDLLFSWVGAEAGAFMLPGSVSPVFYARITDQTRYERAMSALTTSLVAGKDNSLVLDGVRIDRLSIPWYVGLILDSLGVSLPEPYFIVRGDFFFLSQEAENLAAVVKTLDTGDNIATAGPYAALAGDAPADATLLAWYDTGRAEPFFIRGSGLLADILRLYATGVAVVRATPAAVRISVSAARATAAGVRLLPGFPLSPDGSVSEDVLGFRFAPSGPPMLAWLRDRSTLVLADAAGARIAEARLETGSVILAEEQAPGTVVALWAVSPGGTIWRFGPRLEPMAPFPLATGITGSMPPAIIAGKLALFSRADSTIVLIAADGSRSAMQGKLDAPLFTPPDYRAGRLAFFSKSFDYRIHLTDLMGDEAPGWPVQASGISYCAPRIVSAGESLLVTFLTQAGALHAWDMTGAAVPPFPVMLPGVFYATPEPMRIGGQTVLVALAQDGSMSMVGMDGTVMRQTTVPDIDGRNARILLADIDGDGREEILLYGSGAYIAGYDASFRPLPGFPVKGVSRPQLVDLDRDGRVDFVTAGIDGKIFAYTMGGAQR